MILLIDHYDSFSFNLYQLVGSLSSDIKVIRSDELTVKEIEISILPTSSFHRERGGRKMQASTKK